MNTDSTIATSMLRAPGADAHVSPPLERLGDSPAVSPLWRHELILTGALNPGSVSELQEEIECLYQEGVTSLVVDLKPLEAIDLVAVQAIACLGALYKRRGIAVEVRGGSALVRRAMSEAETANERSTPRRFTRTPNNARPARATRMVKAL
jgi:hypothetical protein